MEEVKPSELYIGLFKQMLEEEPAPLLDVELIKDFEGITGYSITDELGILFTGFCKGMDKASSVIDTLQK